MLFLFKSFETHFCNAFKALAVSNHFSFPRKFLIKKKKIPFIKKILQPRVNVSQFEDFTVLAQVA